MAKLTDEQLKKNLTPEQYHILREAGTETPFSGKFLNHKEKGIYTCAACGAELFKSEQKYDSHTPGLDGWPSFYDVASSDVVELKEDNSLGMRRVEVICKNCGSHLGHVFDDSSSPNNRHYCINSTSLEFQDKK